MERRFSNALFLWTLMFAFGVGVFGNSGFMYLERADIYDDPFAGSRRFSSSSDSSEESVSPQLSPEEEQKLHEEIASQYLFWGDLQDQKDDYDYDKRREIRQKRLDKVPQMMRYMKENSADPDLLRRKIKEQEERINTFSNQFVKDLTLTIDESKQVKGSHRGGLILFRSLDWTYGAHDISGRTFGFINDRKRNSIAEEFFGSQEDGSLCITKLVDTSSSPIFGGATSVDRFRQTRNNCSNVPEVFNAVLEVPMDARASLESMIFYISNAVISRFDLILPEDQSKNIYEKVCFDYPLMLFTYSTKDLGVSNLAHTCNEKFCDKYPCVCDRTLFGGSTWNYVPEFCPLSSMYTLSK